MDTSKKNSSCYVYYDENIGYGCVYMAGKIFMDFMNGIKKLEKSKPTFNIDTFHNIGINMIVNLINDAIMLSKQHGKEPNFCVNIDLKGITISHIDHKFYIKTTKTLKTIFVDCLERCYFQNCPVIFDKVYSLIMPFIDPPTRSKIIILKKNKKHEKHENMQVNIS